MLILDHAQWELRLNILPILILDYKLLNRKRIRTQALKESLVEQRSSKYTIRKTLYKIQNHINTLKKFAISY